MSVVLAEASRRLIPLGRGGVCGLVRMGRRGVKGNRSMERRTWMGWGAAIAWSSALWMAGCGTTAADYCFAACDCMSCDEAQLAQCTSDVEAGLARAGECASALRDYLGCLTTQRQCEYIPGDARTCQAEFEGLFKCTGGKAIASGIATCEMETHRFSLRQIECHLPCGDSYSCTFAARAPQLCQDPAVAKCETDCVKLIPCGYFGSDSMPDMTSYEECRSACVPVAGGGGSPEGAP